MKWTLGLFLVLFLAAASYTFGQDKKADWYVTANVNLYIPVGNQTKGMFPILGYDKTMSPKILLGGAGAGAAWLKPLSKDFSIKIQGNLSKHTYWDEPVMTRDYVASALGEFHSWSSDLGLGVAGMVHYFPVESFSIGAGISAQATLISFSKTPGMFVGAGMERGFVTNRYYKTVVPMVPVELSYTLKRLLFNVRYEAGLINRIKGGLGDYKTDKFSLLTFELGFRIN